MYEFVDRSVDRLETGSRFILWAMRGWVRSVTRGRCPPAALADAFSQMGALEVLADFHLLMLCLHREGRGIFAFGELDQLRIAEIEAVMLGIWRDMSGEDTQRVRGLLPLLVNDAAVDTMIEAANRVVAHLSTMGIAPTGLRQTSETALRGSAQ